MQSPADLRHTGVPRAPLTPAAPHLALAAQLQVPSGAWPGGRRGLPAAGTLPRPASVPVPGSPPARALPALPKRPALGVPPLPAPFTAASAAAALRLCLLLSLLPVFLTGSALAGYREWVGDRIYPRVSVVGIDLGGHTREQAALHLREHASVVAQQPVLLRHGGAAWRTTLADLGVGLPDGTLDQAVAAAWATGRVAAPGAWIEQQLALWRRGRRVPLRLALDRAAGEATLRRLAAALDQPPASSRLDVVRTDSGVEVHAVPAQPGRRVDVEATLAALDAALAAGAPAAIDLVVETVPPPVDDAAVAAAQAQVTAALAAPLTLSRDDGQTWQLTPARLSEVVRVDQSDERAPVVLVDQDALRALVDAVAAQADQPAENARLEVRGGVMADVPCKMGRLVDRGAAAAGVLEHLFTDQRSVALPMAPDAPWVDVSDLAPARNWANARLAAPLVLELAEAAADGAAPAAPRRWTLERGELAAFLSLPDTRGIPRPAEGAAKPDLSAAFDAARIRDYLRQHLPAALGLDVAQLTADAALEVRGRSAEIRPGRPGLAPDYDALAAEVAARLSGTDRAARIVTVPLVAQQPRLTDAMQAPAREAANTLVTRPIEVRSDFGTFALTPDQLAGMLKVQVTDTEHGPEVLPYLGRDALEATVQRMAQAVEPKAAGAAAAVQTQAGEPPTVRPMRVDVLATVADIWAHVQSPDDRTAAIQWQE